MTILPPTAPSGLAASALSATQVKLTWTDNSNNETGFRIERATNASFTSAVNQFPVGENVTTYNDNTALANTTYYYRVIAVNNTDDSAASDTATITTPAPSGGGGGGGTTVNTPGLSGTTNLQVNSSGLVMQTTQLSTADGQVTLNIPSTTTMHDAQGNALTTLSASKMTSPPTPPPDGAVVLAYNFGPDGAQFNPPITLTLNYDPNSLPSGTVESKLYIAYWDGTKWQTLQSTVDTANHTVTTQISHFSAFALMVPKIIPTPIPTLNPTPATTPTPTQTPTSTPTPVVTPEPKSATTPAVETPMPSPESKATFRTIWVIIGAVVVIGLIIGTAASRRKTKHS